MLAAAAALAACGDDAPPCGAPVPAVVEATLVTAGVESFSYAGFTAVEGGDCPIDGGRGSVTITGQQPGSGFALTFCVRREDDVKTGQPIQLADDSFIQVVDVSARDAAGCTYARDSSSTPTGTIAFDGFCTTAGAEYNLTLAGSTGGVRTCPQDGGPAMSEPITLTLAGTVRVVMHDEGASP